MSCVPDAPSFTERIGRGAYGVAGNASVCAETSLSDQNVSALQPLPRTCVARGRGYSFLPICCRGRRLVFPAHLLEATRSHLIGALVQNEPCLFQSVMPWSSLATIFEKLASDAGFRPR